MSTRICVSASTPPAMMPTTIIKMVTGRLMANQIGFIATLEREGNGAGRAPTTPELAFAPAVPPHWGCVEPAVPRPGQHVGATDALIPYLTSSDLEGFDPSQSP